MIGLRGAARYLERPEELALELRAVRRVVDAGADNVRLMVPFVRTVEELVAVRALIAESGLLDRGVPLWIMAEVPSNVFLARRFAAEADGVSIGSNDLTQLVLGVDRDCARLADRYSPLDPSVLAAIGRVIEGAHEAGVPVSVCGDAPSREPELVRGPGGAGHRRDLGGAVRVRGDAQRHRRRGGRPPVTPDETRALIARYGAGTRDFFAAGHPPDLMSPLFNMPARLVVGSHCYFEHAPDLLRRAAAAVPADELGRRARTLGHRPNAVGVNSLMLGYLNGREQRRLLAGTAAGRAAAGGALRATPPTWWPSGATSRRPTSTATGS